MQKILRLAIYPFSSFAALPDGVLDRSGRARRGAQRGGDAGDRCRYRQLVAGVEGDETLRLRESRAGASIYAPDPTAVVHLPIQEDACADFGSTAVSPSSSDLAQAEDDVEGIWSSAEEDGVSS